jgi:DNA-directed RNA polymerase specialized sigma24 family protein
MRYWHDMSYEEIAETTRATVSSVKSRLHRARGHVAEMMRATATASAAKDEPAPRRAMPAPMKG